MEQTVYLNNGYENRKHYLQCLAEDLNVPLRTVHAIANMLGADEDFDGLISALEDYEFIGGTNYAR